MTEMTSPRTDPRVARSRRAILDAATTLFLRQGYVATTMDDVAAFAEVSKRTVYNNFADKESLFRDVVLAASSLAETFVAEAADLLADPDDVESTLTDLAQRLAAIVTNPQVVRLRRLVIGEAARFPDLASDYYEQAPGKVLAMLASAFEVLDARGRLHVPDAALAAEQFAYLTLGAALDRALFDGHETAPDATRLARTAMAGVATFFAAHTERKC